MFECIRSIRDYELDNFGEVTTDFSEPEKVVNMYTYIVGEGVAYEFKMGLFGLESQEEIKEQIELWGKKIIPHFK